MKQRSSSLILCFVLIVSFVASVSAQTCVHNGKNFIPNGTYDANRRLILSSLPSNAAAQDGFYSGSIGQEPSRVYAAGMCIPGAEANDCSACIKGASDWLVQARITGHLIQLLALSVTPTILFQDPQVTGRLYLSIWS